MHGMMWWLLGNLQIYDYKLLFYRCTDCNCGDCHAVFFISGFECAESWREEAVCLGVDAEKIKKIVFLVTSLITGALVSVCGMIGFVGLNYSAYPAIIYRAQS